MRVLCDAFFITFSTLRVYLNITCRNKEKKKTFASDESFNETKQNVDVHAFTPF